MKPVFRNFFAVFIVSLTYAYLFYVSSGKLPANMAKDVSEIKIAMITVLSTITGAYFGWTLHRKNDEPNN